MITEVATFAHGYLTQNSQESFNEFVVNTTTSIMLNSGDHSDDEGGPAKRKRVIFGREGGDQVFQPVQQICNYIGVLYSISVQCVEHDCSWHPEELKKPKALLPLVKFGHDHEAIASAVQQLAETLEANADPKDENMLLLANAISHLFEDINILMNTPSVNNYISIINNINIAIEAVNNCTNDDTCYNNLCDQYDYGYNQYDHYYPYEYYPYYYPYYPYK